MEKDPPIPMTTGSFKAPVKIYEVNTNFWISTFQSITQKLSRVLPKIQNIYSGKYVFCKFTFDLKTNPAEANPTAF